MVLVNLIFAEEWTSIVLGDLPKMLWEVGILISSIFMGDKQPEAFEKLIWSFNLPFYFDDYSVYLKVKKSSADWFVGEIGLKHNLVRVDIVSSLKILSLLIFIFL